MQSPARIAVCEDSPTYAAGLRRFLERDGDLKVVGVCKTAEELLQKLPELAPDLVTMDVELPGMDGIEATRRLMRDHPLPVIVLSAHTGRGSERAAAALAAGAFDAMPKAAVALDNLDTAAAVAMRRRLRRLASTHPARARRRSGRAPSGPAAKRLEGFQARVIAIAASTGGPRALDAVLSPLPASFPLPIVVVQHMTPGFTAGLVRWLDDHVTIPVRLAEDDAGVGPGVWFAPDGAHLLLKAGMSFELDSETVEGAHRPSGDILLKSAAAAAGRRSVGIVLTGMGRDGAVGAAAVRGAGGLLIAQDEASSAVYGMPRAAAQGGVDLVLPAEAIAGALLKLGATAG